MESVQCVVCDGVKGPHHAVTCPQCKVSCCSRCYSKAIRNDFGIKCVGCSDKFVEPCWTAIFPPSVLTKVRHWTSQRLFKAAEAEAHTAPLQERAARERQARVVDQDLVPIEAAMAACKAAQQKLRTSLKRLCDESLVIKNKAQCLRAPPVPEAIPRLSDIICVCLGRVDEHGYCSLCTASTCMHCHDPAHTGKQVLEGHEMKTVTNQSRVGVCSPGLLTTAEVVHATTRPCPKCRVKITKLDGCDQMWCTQCQCFFSWLSEEEYGPGLFRHNPEYTAYLEGGGTPPPEPPAPPHHQWTTASIKVSGRLLSIDLTPSQSSQLANIIESVDYMLHTYPTDLGMSLAIIREDEMQAMVNFTLGTAVNSQGTTTVFRPAKFTKVITGLAGRRTLWEAHQRWVRAFVLTMEALFASLTERFCPQTLHREVARLVAYFRTCVYELGKPEALLKADLRIIDHSWNFVCTARALLDW